MIPLPTKKLEQFKQDFVNPALSMYELTIKYGRPAGTLYRWGNVDLGLKRPTLKVDGRTVQRDLLAFVSKGIQAIPQRIDIPYPKIIYKRGSLILLLSDLHAGRKTMSFNSEVLKKRLAYLGTCLDDFASQVDCNEKLYIFALGDFVLGERIGYQVNLDEIEYFIYTQIFELLVPYLSQWLIDRLHTFGSIEIHGVRGNHGELGKFQSQTANWDTFVYKIIEQRLANEQRIAFDIAIRQFYQFVDVQKTTFLNVHGDQFKVAGGKPFASIFDKVLKWSRGGMPQKFTHVACAHMHSKMSFVVGDAPVYVNGTLLSDDDWVREVLGLKGSCSQTILHVVGDKVEDEHEVFLDVVK